MDYIARVNELEAALRLIPRRSRERQDCQRMLNHVRDLQQDISRELVECRRLRRETARFTELAKEFELCAQNLDHHILMARLIRG